MKKLDESTIGGRIRKSRSNLVLMQKEFAERLNVSSNYLGMVERGEKNPSEQLLKQIADVTGVSYKWLLTGEADPQEASGGKAGAAAEEAPPVFAGNVSPQLIVALALRSHIYNKETLATFLMVPVETVDRILAGEAVEYNPMWGNIFPVLVHGLDIPAVRQELRTLDAFLARASDSLGRMKLLQSLQAYANGKPATEDRPRQVYRIAGGVENRVEEYDTEGGEPQSVTASRMMLDSDGGPDGKWYFAYYPFKEAVSKDTIEEVFEQELDYCKGTAVIGSGSIVTNSRTVFEKFCNTADAYLDRCDVWQHDPDGKIGENAFPKYFSIILIDAESLSVEEEIECEDAEYKAALEESYRTEF